MVHLCFKLTKARLPVNRLQQATKREDNGQRFKLFRNYCGLTRSGFYWQKTTKGDSTQAGSLSFLGSLLGSLLRSLLNCFDGGVKFLRKLLHKSIF